MRYINYSLQLKCKCQNSPRSLGRSGAEPGRAGLACLGQVKNQQEEGCGKTSFLESLFEMIYNQKRIFLAFFALANMQPKTQSDSETRSSNKSWHFIDAHKFRRLAAIKPTRPQGHGRTSVICLQRLAQKNREPGKFVSGAPGNQITGRGPKRQKRQAKRQKVHWIYVAAIYGLCAMFSGVSGLWSLVSGPWSRSLSVRSLVSQKRVSSFLAEGVNVNVNASIWVTPIGGRRLVIRPQIRIAIPGSGLMFSLFSFFFNCFFVSSPLDVYLGHVLLLWQWKKFRHKYWNLCSTRKKGWPNRPITKLSCPVSVVY